MSKLIVEMEFRKNCLDCDLHQIVYGDSYADTDVYCLKEKRFVGKRFGTTKDLARPDWCPIKGVLPEQHGDLIDRDAYLKLLGSYIESKRGVCENKEFIVALQAISKQLKCVKAVIAAERKDDGTTAD